MNEWMNEWIEKTETKREKNSRENNSVHRKWINGKQKPKKVNTKER